MVLLLLMAIPMMSANFIDSNLYLEVDTNYLSFATVSEDVVFVKN